MRVYFEETGEAREVVGKCRVCFPPGYRSENALVYLVSPQGLEHESAGFGETDCGKDATGPKWWWRI